MPVRLKTNGGARQSKRSPKNEAYLDLYILLFLFFLITLPFLLHYFCKILELLLFIASNEQLMSYTVKFEIQPNLCNLSF